MQSPVTQIFFSLPTIPNAIYYFLKRFLAFTSRKIYFNVSKTHRGLVDADENGYTSSKGIFAAGDIVTGPKTVVEALAFAKKVADEIDKYCLEN
jgi:NADPH-dependent glutamate synthase beta subunit-like oxidoreductase